MQFVQTVFRKHIHQHPSNERLYVIIV